MQQIKDYILWLLLAGMLLSVAVMPTASRADDVGKEYQLKAAYLFNFARFTKWPDASYDTASDGLNICVVGENPFGSILAKLETRKIENRRVKVHYLPDVDAADLGRCQLAFYGDLQTVAKMQLLSKSLVNTVHVSDVDGFCRMGGDIELFWQKNKLRFNINNSAMKSKMIQPRASLLDMAAEVY